MLSKVFYCSNELGMFDSKQIITYMKITTSTLHYRMTRVFKVHGNQLNHINLYLDRVFYK